jgi:hypothetical protein
MSTRLTKLEQEIQRGELDPGTNSRPEIALRSAPGCVGLEVGVDTGQLSERFIQLGHFSSFHCVDKWDDHAHSREQYLAVTKRLLPYAGVCPAGPRRIFWLHLHRLLRAYRTRWRGRIGSTLAKARLWWGLLRR